MLQDPVKAYLSKIGRKGGAAGRGAAKARTSEQARAAAYARWGLCQYCGRPVGSGVGDRTCIDCRFRDADRRKGIATT
jgi:hypothetical protein